MKEKILFFVHRVKISFKKCRLKTKVPATIFLILVLILIKAPYISPDSSGLQNLTHYNEIKTISIFPGTGVGKKAEEFWRAFDRAEAAGLEAFFARNLPPGKLQQIPARDRAQRLLGLRQRLGKELKLIKVIQPSPEEVSLFIEGVKNQLFKLTLVFEKMEEKFWLKALTVDEAGAEDLAPPPPQMTLEEALKAIEQQIEKAVQEDSFSGVVLIARHFQPVFFKSYGFASKEFRVPNRTDTRFNLGSINKIFTRIATGKLAEQGRLKLDDKLGKFLPDYPNAEAREKVTVRHLVNMTSGIGDFFGPEFEKTPKNFLRHNRDYLKLFAHKPLAFEPGEREMYSNGGYVVLGEIISAVSGLDYYEFINRNIFEPAGMKNSGWFQADAVVENVAEGYTRQMEEKNAVDKNPDAASEKPQQAVSELKMEKKETPAEVTGSEASGEKQVKKAAQVWRRNIYTRPARGSAAGGGYATAEDLLLFARALYEGRLLSDAWTEWVFSGLEPGPSPAKAGSEQTKAGSMESSGHTIADKQSGPRPARSDSDLSLRLSTTQDRISGTGKEMYGPQIKPDRSGWNLAIAGGAPGINAVLEFEAATGYTIIVLSNYDPPAAMQISRMIRLHLKAVSY